MNASRAALIAAVLSIAVARAAGAAEAADSKLRVVIVVDESDDPFAERIKAEVSALGFEVVAIEPWRTGESVESLDAVGRANQAAAAIRMIASRKGVEVWIANQPTGRSLMRQLIVDERPAPNEGLVALQTAELLRTTLLSRSDVPPKAPPPPSVPSEKPPGVAPPPPSSSGRRRQHPGRRGRAVHPRRRSGAAALVHGRARHRAPVRPRAGRQRAAGRGSVTGPEGAANVRTWLAGISVFVRRERPDSLVYAIAAAGAALIHLTADATANPPLVATPTARPPPRSTRASTAASRRRLVARRRARRRRARAAGRAGPLRGKRSGRVGPSVPGGMMVVDFSW